MVHFRVRSLVGWAAHQHDHQLRVCNENKHGNSRNSWQTQRQRSTPAGGVLTNLTKSVWEQNCQKYAALLQAPGFDGDLSGCKYLWRFVNSLEKSKTLTKFEVMTCAALEVWHIIQNLNLQLSI
jgi:hypothetical protein